MTRGAGEAVRKEAEKSYRQVRFEMGPQATEILLVRHGESMPVRESAPFELLDGHGDPALAPEGREQAEALADLLAAEGSLGAIYVTNLRRTRETAAPLAARLGLEPRVEADLREVLLGEWEGGAYRRHVTEGHPLAAEMLRRERWDVIPGAESNEEFAARLEAGIERIAAAHKGERVVAVTHGGAIGMILSRACGARPFSFVGSDNASISRLVVMPERWLVRSFNETGHLKAL